MSAPLPVTDADVRLAWDDFYARPDELHHIEILSPDQNHLGDRLILAGLKRVLENDRRRIAERSA